MDSILYIDDEKENLHTFKSSFSQHYQIFVAQDTKAAYELLKKNEISVVITDQRMPDETGIEFIERVQDEFQDVIFMILSGYSDFNVMVKAIESGRVYAFLQKPWIYKELLVDINNAIEKYHILKWNKLLLINLEKQNNELRELKQSLEDENTYLKTEITKINNFESIITEDRSFLQTLNIINQVSFSDAPVLITGETGTGKELIARTIHNLGDRNNMPFISVNCAAIPETLFESELFGHEKGAFTGAIFLKKGKFELAKNGTLFLDEVGEIPKSMQPKLLRAIQENCIERVGGTKTIPLNLRIISATNRNLDLEIEKGNFRSDLYYRLNVIPIEVPPLRDRRNDIPLLVDYFVYKYNKKYHTNIRKVPTKTMGKLKAYDWPGNIRELENIIERGVITSKKGILQIEYMIPSNGLTDNINSDNLIEMERNHIIKVLKKTSWKISGPGGAAEKLGMNRTTLHSRMKKLNISITDNN